MADDKTHTTNYTDTFIAVATDSTAERGMVPREAKTPSVATRTFEMISKRPYAYTSDDVIFGVWADRNDIAKSERKAARAAFFSKGQPCLRASDLGKKYGWGIHADGTGKIALYGVETGDYAELASGTRDGKPVAITRAMRSKR